MVDCALMAKLFEAVSPGSRIILIGDKDQLASVEAGSILADLAGTGENRYGAELTETVQGLIPDFNWPAGAVPLIADSIVTLTENYRFGGGSGIGEASAAINRGDSNATVSILAGNAFSDCIFRTPPSYQALLDRVRERVFENLKEALASSDPAIALTLFNGFRVLCAVRNGPFGVAAMNGHIEAALDREGLIDATERHYHGRPILVTGNDYRAGLFNGDSGIIMQDRADHGSLKAFFRDGRGGTRSVSLFRLPPHETSYAMTVHKAQGSEFDSVILILPSRPSPIVTRELLYTGITRCRKQCELWCTEDVLRHAVATSIRRTSGLREALWGGVEG